MTSGQDHRVDTTGNRMGCLEQVGQGGSIIADVVDVTIQDHISRGGSQSCHNVCHIGQGCTAFSNIDVRTSNEIDIFIVASILEQILFTDNAVTGTVVKAGL